MVVVEGDHHQDNLRKHNFFNQPIIHCKRRTVTLFRIRAVKPLAIQQIQRQENSIEENIYRKTVILMCPTSK